MNDSQIRPMDGAIPARKFDNQLWIPADVAIELRSKDRAAIDRLTAELEAYKTDADMWRFCNGKHQVDDSERIECHVKVGVNVWHGEEWRAFYEGSPSQVRKALESACAQNEESSHD